MDGKEKFICYCGDWRFRNAHFVIDDIRTDVCRELPLYGEIDGKQYCVLHYPHKDKAKDFEVVFQARIDSGKWDFRMVYFPQSILHESKEFQISANFSHAIFAEIVSFKHCKFSARFDFFDARFLDDAFFTYSEFFKQVNFNSADFREHGNFAGVTFHEKSYPSFNQTKFKSSSFGSAKFHDEAKFSKASFSDGVDFFQAEFLSKADFKNITPPQNGKAKFEAATFHNSANFENVEFYEADFSRARFLSSSSAFNQIVFKNSKFKKSVSFAKAEFHSLADFSNVSFQNVHFESAMFANQANFREAAFVEDAFFNDTKFGYKDEHRIRSSQVNFDGATFGKDSRAFFDDTWFSWHTSFDYVRFDGYVIFKGSQENPVFDTVFEEHAFWSLLKILNATFEKPEKVYFETVRLRPSWLINIGSELRKFNFKNINWTDENGKFITIDGELKNIEKLNKHDSKRLLSVVFRHLAENAETNNRFEEASTFRRMAMETEWLEKRGKFSNWIANLDAESEKLKNRFGGSTEEEDRPTPPTNSFGILRRSGDFIIHGLYRITSFYGESWSWAAGVLLTVLVVFAFLYTRVDFYVCPPDKPASQSTAQNLCRTRTLDVFEASRHSLATATFQNVDYRRPVTGSGETAVLLEKIFAPLQAALLALAIRRKFMR
jgi:uncharacterized protein YjbI with pentapeptide repeats